MFSERNLIVAWPIPRSRNVKYPTKSHKIDNRPNDSVPSLEMMNGMQTIAMIIVSTCEPKLSAELCAKESCLKKAIEYRKPRTWREKPLPSFYRAMSRARYESRSSVHNMGNDETEQQARHPVAPYRYAENKTDANRNEKMTEDHHIDEAFTALRTEPKYRRHDAHQIWIKNHSCDTKVCIYLTEIGTSIRSYG